MRRKHLLGVLIALITIYCSNLLLHFNFTKSVNMNVNKHLLLYFTQLTHSSNTGSKRQTWDHTYREEDLFRNKSTFISRSDLFLIDMDKVPTVPCLSLDSHLLVLSASASRIRYGTSITFSMVHPTVVKDVLPKDNTAKPLFSNQLSLRCGFDDGSMTPTYTYYYKDPYQDVSLLDCPLSSFASDQLWRNNRTLRVYLLSQIEKDLHVPILKALITVPTYSTVQLNSNRQLLTLCTSPLHNKAKYLAQWIEFHRLVGFRKFVVYNTTDEYQELLSTVNAINKKHPHMVDVIQWNFSSLSIIDTFRQRYFQLQALHDCLIRYGDQSEWMGAFDLDEYIVPLHPYKTIHDYLQDEVGSRVIGSINLWSQYFCSREFDQHISEEKNETLLVIERFTHRAKSRFKLGHQKYLYRPRFVQYLSIHYHLVGVSKLETSENSIMLAHYVNMERLRKMPGCDPKEYVNDTSIRDRFANIVKMEIAD